MILEGKTDTILMEDGDVQDSTKMEIDADSHIFLMRMLSKFYSDGIGSLIRETASNALDSHRECGVNEPIIVSFKKNKDGNYEFSVQDFGCGLDDMDVENIIKKYGKSTKRLKENQLGAFGLGFKSPLAYTSSFYFIGRKGGIERKWMLYESDDESNRIDLLNEAPTTERNGVKVIVPVKFSDASQFWKKIMQQLAYFENVYFDCTDWGTSVHNDKVKIVRADNFQWSSLNADNGMHICLDNVYYPIDYDKLGITRIQFPVGLRFSLTDGLFPVPNREQLKYTAEAKKIILDKIVLVADYFVSKYNDSIEETDDIFNIFSHYSSNHRSIPSFDGTNKLDITVLEKYSKLKFLEPKLKGLKYLKPRRVYELRDYLIAEYGTKYTFSSGRFTLEKEGGWKGRIDLEKVKNGEVYLFSELTAHKKAYLRDTLINGRYAQKYFVKRSKPFRLGHEGAKGKFTGRGYDSYYTILGLHSIPKKEWRERIKEWQYLVSLAVSKFIDVDKIDIPQSWFDSRKKKRVEIMEKNGTKERRKKLTGEITGKVGKPLERFVSGKECKFVSEVFQMKDAYKDKVFTIYGSDENEPLFQKLYTILVKKDIRLVILSERELKNMKDIQLHNWMEIGKFMTGKHRIFRRAVTAYLIYKLQKDFEQVFNKYYLLKEISTPLWEKMTKLQEYNKKYYTRGDDALYATMLSVADEYKLYDTSIYNVYKEVEFILNRLSFIEPMFSKLYYETEKKYIKAIRDLFKYYKQRVDWQHYKLVVNEESIEVVEKELETVDEF